jgi:hypothetical protein
MRGGTWIWAIDVIAFVRDNFDDQPFDAPETARSCIGTFAAAARRSVEGRESEAECQIAEAEEPARITLLRKGRSGR